MTHGDDFVLSGPTERLTEFENKMTGVHLTKSKLVSYWSSENIKALNRRLHWESEVFFVSVIPDMSSCL